MPQQYPHPSATLHPHPQHPQPSATPTGQAQQGGPPQHGGPPSHPAASPVQHQQHQQAAAGERIFFPDSSSAFVAVQTEVLTVGYSSSSSGGGPGPPPGQPAPAAADVLGFGPHPPFHDPWPQPAVSPGVLSLSAADRLHPPTANSARLQPQPHGTRATGRSQGAVVQALPAPTQTG